MSSSFQIDLTPLEESISRVAQTIAGKLAASKSLWIMGNGGSASTADHFEIDLLSIKFPQLGTPIRAFSMNSNLSVITAIANDVGYDEVFSLQLMRKATSGDVAVLISASGSSPNLVKAAEICRLMEIETIGILGFDGGALRGKLTHLIHIETPLGEYAESENYHLAVCHRISRLIREMFFGKASIN